MVNGRFINDWIGFDVGFNNSYHHFSEFGPDLNVDLGDDNV